MLGTKTFPIFALFIEFFITHTIAILLKRHYSFLPLQIWPMVNLINFYYVPFQLRPLVISIVALFWHTFLAYTSNGNLDKVKQA